MSRFTRTASVTALSLSFACAPSLAGAAGTQPRAWVSAAHGADGASCGTTASPCRTFQYAHTNIVASGGSIFVLDPGEYGPVSIVNPVSIINDGVGAATVTTVIDAAPSGYGYAAGIDINLPSGGNVVLKGLTINVANAGYGSLFGIKMGTAGNLSIVKCAVSSTNNSATHFGFGVYIWPFPTSGAVAFNILNSAISGSNYTGLTVKSEAGSGIQGVVRRVDISRNGFDGFVLYGNGGTAVVRLEDNVVSNNDGSGVWEAGAGGTGVTLNRVTATFNASGADLNLADANSGVVTSFKTNTYGTSTGPISTANLH